MAIRLQTTSTEQQTSAEKSAGIVQDGQKLTWLYEQEARAILKKRFENDGRVLTKEVTEAFVNQYAATGKACHRRFGA